MPGRAVPFGPGPSSAAFPVQFAGPMSQDSAASALEERLRDLIRDVPDFPRPGVLFKDVTTLLRDAGAFREAVDSLAAAWRDERIDIVVGVESRGFVIGGALAYVLDAG